MLKEIVVIADSFETGICTVSTSKDAFIIILRMTGSVIVIVRGSEDAFCSPMTKCGWKCRVVQPLRYSPKLRIS